MTPRVQFCPEDLWGALVRGDSTATFFQTPTWLGLTARHLSNGHGARAGTEPAPLLFDFPGGPACLPLLRDLRWGRPRYFSPFGTYTALLSPRSLDGSEIAVVQSTLRDLNLQFAVSPFSRNPAHAGTVTRSRTQVIDLTSAHAETPEHDWDPDPRRRLRIAGESGVRVRAAASAEDWDAYYGLYLKSLERWGAGATAAYPRALFDAIREASEAPESGETRGPAMRLWLAEHEGVPAGGYIAFYHNHHACIWHGAADQAYFKLGATQLLYREMIGDAARRGFAVFDLMGSAGLKPLEAFKASLGARTMEYDTCLNRTGLVGLLSGALAGMRTHWRRSGPA